MATPISQSALAQIGSDFTPTPEGVFPRFNIVGDLSHSFPEANLASPALAATTGNGIKQKPFTL